MVKTTAIRFTSRASVKIGDSFYTLEACEERQIQDEPDESLPKHRKDLWDTVNGELDSQIDDIIQSYKKGK